MDKRSSFQRDVFIVVFGAIVTLFITLAFNLFDYVIEFVVKHEAWQIDEIFTLTVYATIALAILSYRRWMDAKKEIELRQLLEKDLILAKNETELANVRLNRFLADMNHEIRTPLNSIMGFSEMLLDETFGELSETQREYGENISKSGTHLLHLINQLLDLAKIESGKSGLNIEEFSIQELLDEVNSILAVLARKKRLVLSYDIDHELDVLKADRLKLKQILFNLASNAIKFTPESGHVKIEAKKEGNMLLIRVIDSGRGIEKNEIEKIFEPFEQLDTMEDTGYRGTGLGLAIVKDLVDMFKGKIWVESELGKGSTFSMLLPLDLSAEN